MAGLLSPPPNVFEPPTLLYTFYIQPLKTLIRLIFLGLNALRTAPRPASPSLRVICISDTHTLKTAIPHGDLLIHAGDLTDAGTADEIQAQIDWLDGLPHEHKIAIAGNHDTLLDPRSRRTLSPREQTRGVDWKGVRYLQHSTANLRFRNGRALRVYGAPQIPHDGSHGEFAFQYLPGFDAWTGTIPLDTDVLVTHSPPKGHLDLPAALGCEHLLAETWKVRPTLHVFGHIHAGKTDFLGWLKAGREIVRWDTAQQRLDLALTRPDGLVRGLLDPRAWIDVSRTLFYGAVGVLWDRVWGGESPPTTTMVLASLMYNGTGKIGHEAQVVDI